VTAGLVSEDRYARQRLVPGWDQQRLRSARVVVIGVGALGNEVARVLTMSGVGELILCDPDTVEASNLSRTILFRTGDIGRPKAEAAAAALCDLAPGVDAEARVADLVSGVGLAELRDADLVVSCLDSAAARVGLAERCGRVGAALLDAGTQPWGGEVRYYPAGGACFGCALTPAERRAEDDRYSCATYRPGAPAAASAPIAGQIGAWQATFAIRLLCGLPVVHGVLAVDGAGTAGRVQTRGRDPRCPLHAGIGAVERLAVSAEDTVADLLGALRPGEVPEGWAEFDRPLGGRSRTLSAAPPDRRLYELGVAPREVLRVVPARATDPMRHVELAERKGP